jgi:integrase
MGLTIKRVAALSKRPGRYFDRAGLYLQVPEAGKIAPREQRASWLLRYELKGVCRWMGLGALADYDLVEARERARKARQLLTDGIDPIEARKAGQRERETQARATQAIPTFAEAADRYFAVRGGKWRNPKHAVQFASSLKVYAFPRLGALRVNDITTDDVLKAIEPIWKRIPATASRVRGRIESVLSWAIANRFREGPNPARWADNLEHLLAAPSSVASNNHHAALPFAELPAFLEALREREGIAARALEFLILTAARTGETIGATWSEIDLTAKEWTVPATRMKSGKAHRVPLSDRAVEILRGLPTERGNECVFIGPRSNGLSTMAMDAVLRRMNRKDVTVHGFRSTFRDWAAERTNYPNHVVEMALAHTIGSAVEAAYRRGELIEKRRKLTEAWAKYCTTRPVEAGTKVVSLRRAR